MVKLAPDELNIEMIPHTYLTLCWSVFNKVHDFEVVKYILPASYVP